jgi:hypothetical protein
VTGEIGGTNPNMMNRKCIGSLIVGASLAGAGCGEVTAEPIRSVSIPITSVDIDEPDLTNPYACEITQTADGAADGLELVPFLTLGALSYAGKCSSPEQARQCWYTNDMQCQADTDDDCGGFVGRVDPVTGAYELDGGQHMLCPYSCVRDDECPASATGTARPTCMLPPEFDPATDGGTCMLGCGSGEACPDGFVCVDPGLSFSTSDGTLVPAPAQCVQFHRLTAHGDPTPP